MKTGTTHPRHLISAETEPAFENITWSEVENQLLLEDYFRLTGVDFSKKQAEAQAFLLEKNLLILKDDRRFDVPHFSAFFLAKDFFASEKTLRNVLRCTVSKATDRTKPAIFDQDFSCGLIRSFTAFCNTVLEHLPKKDLLAHDSKASSRCPRLPPIAVCELLRNAVQHQALGQTVSKVAVEIFEDRIEISNPGIPVLSPKEFSSHAPCCRNTYLSQVMQLLRTEKLSESGWHTALNALKTSGSALPSIRVGCASTTITLRF